MSTDTFSANPLAYVQSAVESNKQVADKVKKLKTSLDTTIDFTRWNKLYPYALVLAEASVSSPTSYTEKARFVLPIPPDQLQIQTPFAIQVTKTLGGVVEEHNGVPFKMIMASGTTGTYPLKGSVVPSVGQPIFGGLVTSLASDASANQAGNFVAVSPSPGIAPNPGDEAQGTGYGQFRLLKLFLEGYARAKKNGDGNRNLRLLFIPFKDEVAYVVTPVSFNMRKEAGRALKYRYDLQLKAWAEFPSRQLNRGGNDFEVSTSVSNLNKALALLDKARKAVTQLRSIVRTTRGAVQTCLNIMREGALFCKDNVGVAVSLFDLPFQLVRDCQGALLQSKNILVTALEDLDGINQKYAALLSNSSNKNNNQVNGTNDGSEAAGGDSGTAGASNETPANPLNDAFKNPDSDLAYVLFNALKIEQLELSIALQNKIDSEIARVRAYTNADFVKMRAELAAAIVEIADTFGASDPTYDATYSNIHPVTDRVPTQGDHNALFALNDALEAMNLMAAQPAQRVTTMEYVAGLASKSGIAFQVPVSKFGIPFPFDYTLEDLANQYLGDVDRWMEIATLNGLREPYVDEVGFTYALVSNGFFSEITVGSDANLMIGQPIWLQSNYVPREKRHILNIKVVGPSNVVLTLDGSADLDKFHTAAMAYVQAFLPYTINSHQLIYLPSDKETSFNEDLARIPGVDAFDDLLEVGGVDLLLTSDNDLAITPDGDCRLAFGMQALIQRARIALGTPRGSLIRHKTFGFPIQAGQSIADLDINEAKLAISDMFKEDPSFDGVIKVSIVQAGAAMNVSISLAVTGQDTPLSVNFLVKK
jgi:hypothetical protein